MYLLPYIIADNYVCFYFIFESLKEGKGNTHIHIVVYWLRGSGGGIVSTPL